MLMWMLLTFLLASFSSLSTDPSSLALSNRLRLDLLVTSTTANLDLLTDSIKLHLFSAVEANSASIRINSHSDLSVVASFSKISFLHQQTVASWADMTYCISSEICSYRKNKSCYLWNQVFAIGLNFDWSEAYLCGLSASLVGTKTWLMFHPQIAQRPGD